MPRMEVNSSSNYLIHQQLTFLLFTSFFNSLKWLYNHKYANQITLNYTAPFVLGRGLTCVCEHLVFFIIGKFFIMMSLGFRLLGKGVWLKNYPHVNLFSLFSKIFEKFVTKRVADNLAICGVF